MRKQESMTIYTDGASRGNPGPAAYAYIIQQPGHEPIRVKGRLQDTTNNVAEYTALIKALEHARTLDAARVVVLSDSELMVNQITGAYKVKSPDLRPLFNNVKSLEREFDSFEIRHIAREQNREADKLCNQALDASRHAAKSATTKQPSAAKQKNMETVREEAIACLTAVAQAWSQGGPNNPTPEEVWDQLWSIVEEAGLV